MSTDTTVATPPAPVDDLYADVRDLGLGPYVKELESQGYTIVPPDKIGPADLPARVLAETSRVIEERIGIRLDLEAGESRQDLPQAAETHNWLLFDDPVFEELLMNPVSLTLMTYLLTTGNEPLRPSGRPRARRCSRSHPRTCACRRKASSKGPSTP